MQCNYLVKPIRDLPSPPVGVVLVAAAMAEVCYTINVWHYMEYGYRTSGANADLSLRGAGEDPRLATPRA